MEKHVYRWAAAAFFLATSGVAGHVSAKDLVVAEVLAAEHIIVKSEELMASRVAELTGGQLKLQIKHSAQLGNENQYWDKVRNGSLDIARVNLGVLVNDVASAKLLSLPYLFRSRDHMWRVLAGDFGKRIKAEVEKTGAVVLAYYDSGTRCFYTTKKPIQKRADFAGQRIRVQNSPVYQDLVTELGGKPLVIGYDKVVEAFKNGEIDGAENNLPSYVSSDHYKYARYYSMDEHSSVPEVLLVSKKVWDGLTPDQRSALSKAAEESSVSMKKLWAEAEAQALAKVKKEGVTVIDKHQIHMSGIETSAVKLYSKYVTNPEDLGIVLGILRSE